MSADRLPLDRPPVLSIAGSDSGGGAGIQADLHAIAALGGWGMTALASLTAQSPKGVFGIHDVPPDFVRLQMEVVLRDMGAAAIKTGMLSTEPIIESVAEVLAGYRNGLSQDAPAPLPVGSAPLPEDIAIQAFDNEGTPLGALPESAPLPSFKLVVDPVMVATSGARLLQEDAIQTMIQRLFPLATVITPNIPEAEVLAGHAIRDDGTLLEAGRGLFALLQAEPGTGRYVLLKGGHLGGDEAADWLYDGVHWLRFSTPRLAVPEARTHGTGCTYASAIAAALTRYPIYEAFARAKAHITARLRGDVP